MIVGIPREIKADENRVAMTPAGVEVMKHHRHEILIEKQAGLASGFEDEDYRSAGAEIVDSPGDIFGRAEMILRVKEPQPSEIVHLQEGQIYFSYLHLAASEQLTLRLLETGSINIAYETIQKDDGTLPLLMPMSEVAGAMAIQEGAKYLEMAQGGNGVLLGGVPGVEPATVVIIGGGVVGSNAAKMASGLGANVYVLDIDLERLRYLSDVMPANCFIGMSSPAAIRDLVVKADVVVGAALVPGARTPVLVSRDALKTMKRGSVVVDVSIDQGGCFESSRETTHRRPTYVLDGIVHYAVSNMPGALPRTASLALTNATLPYVLEIAEQGWKKALRENSAIRRGANVVKGKVTFKGVADALNLEFTPIEDIIG
jgi:alanine dehydrogenase